MFILKLFLPWYNKKSNNKKNVNLCNTNYYFKVQVYFFIKYCLQGFFYSVTIIIINIAYLLIYLNMNFHLHLF